MPHFDIVKKIDPPRSFRVASVIDRFDLQTGNIREQFTGSIDIEGMPWNVGLIVGKSGTGKTSIAKQLFTRDIVTEFPYVKPSIIDDMPAGLTVDQIVNVFNSVGFSSPHSWVKKYSVLSNGEKMRVNLARAILDQRPLIVFDEFTSVVDRNVAQLGSYATQKIVRQRGKKFIALSCHYDVVDWLLPDWIFCTDDMTFTVTSKKKDHRSNARFIEQRTKESGECLLSITI